MGHVMLRGFVTENNEFERITKKWSLPNFRYYKVKKTTNNLRKI
jgi:hypothetical protein